MDEMTICRRAFMKAMGLGAASTLLASEAARSTSPRPARPNLILLLADDMGYADPSCFGGKAVATPAIDALAARGMRFTQFYSASAVCTPTRASVLTGKYPLRFDIRRHFSDDESHLPRGTVTLPALLRKVGYRTAQVGKWHLGGLHVAHIEDRAHSIPGPHEHGFDHYLCQIEEQPLRGRLGAERRLYRDGGTCLIRDEKRVPPGDPYYPKHFTDIIGEESIRWIESCHAQGKPFFLNAWWLVPHTPYEPAPEPYWSRTAAPDISDDQHCFRSMVAHLDAWIGRISAKLDEMKIRENTFIIFTSDNGGAYEADIGPFRGGKTDLHEGGIRVPMIATWPVRIRAGSESGSLAHTNDILPTFCAAAGVELPAGERFDGVNLLPHMTDGASIQGRPTVFWQIDFFPALQRRAPKPEPHATEVARRGRWKLFARDGEPLGLFDIEEDPREEHDLRKRRPDLVKELAAELKAWLAEPRKRWE